ncbi:MAG: AI-2E family transporter [Patescibacteria group bacterium]
MPLNEYTISIGAIFKVALAVGLIVVLYQTIDILLIVFLGIVIASALEPAISRMKEWGIPRIGGALLIYILTFSFLGVIFFFLLPPLFTEFTEFLRDFPKIQKNLTNSNVVFQYFPIIDIINQNIPLLSASTKVGALKGIGSAFLNFSSEIFGGIISFMLLIVISFYLSVQERGIVRFLQAIMPLKYEEYALDIWSRTRRKLGILFQTMFALSAIVGTLVYVSLSIIGIKFAFLLGVLSAIFELVPIVGPILAAIPGVTLGLLQSPETGLMVFLVYVVIQQLENHAIVPLIMRRTVGINPLIIILSLLVGGKLAGILGLLVAVPMAVVIMEIIEDIDRRRRITT